MTAIKYDAHSFLASPDAWRSLEKRKGEGSVCIPSLGPLPLFCSHCFLSDEFSFPFLFDPALTLLFFSLSVSGKCSPLLLLLLHLVTIGPIGQVIQSSLTRGTRERIAFHDSG